MENWISEEISRKALERFDGELRRTGTQLHSLILYRDGQCLAHWGIAPYSCRDKREVYSLSKSFTSTAVGLAFDRGALHPDDPLSRFFPQQVAAQQDPRWQRVRLRHLLSMTVGHAACPMAHMAFAPDSVQAFFSTPLEYEPGEHFAYSTGAGCILAEVVRRATGWTVPDFLARELYAPMGIENSSWDTCRDGHCQGGTGLKASAEDVAKLGLLYCQNGMWNGKRLLSPQWVEMAGAIQARNDGNGTPDWCAGYGFQFWKNAKAGFRGDGAFGQLCVILPEQKTVAVVLAESVNMTAELNAVWSLLRCCGREDAGKGLPTAYPPPMQEGGHTENEAWDSGWLTCGENPMGFTSLRLCAENGGLELTLCDGERAQTLRADGAHWTENLLWAKEFRPLLYRQMPRTEYTCQRLAVACRRLADGWVLDCRMLNAPHQFQWQFQKSGETLEIQIHGRVDVFGAAGAWCAARKK